MQMQMQQVITVEKHKWSDQRSENGKESVGQKTDTTPKVINATK